MLLTVWLILRVSHVASHTVPSLGHRSCFFFRKAFSEIVKQRYITFASIELAFDKIKTLGLTGLILRTHAGQRAMQRTNVETSTKKRKSESGLSL